MTSNQQDFTSLIKRLERVEKQNRKLRLTGILTLSLFFLLSFIVGIKASEDLEVDGRVIADKISAADISASKIRTSTLEFGGGQ